MLSHLCTNSPPLFLRSWHLFWSHLIYILLIFFCLIFSWFSAWFVRHFMPILLTFYALSFHFRGWGEKSTHDHNHNPRFSTRPLHKKRKRHSWKLEKKNILRFYFLKPLFHLPTCPTTNLAVRQVGTYFFPICEI